MKKQDASNDDMKQCLDDVLTTLTKLGNQQVEDKGSSFKDKKPQGTRHFYSHPHSTHAHFDATEDVNWSHHDNTFVEYELDDCPWTANELEQFYEFAAVPYHGQIPPPKIHQEQRQFHHQVPPHVPETIFIPPANQFQTQMHFQHKAVAKGLKLSFPEFDGSDPDGWIRKAEKYFEMVGVPNEESENFCVIHQWKG